MGNRALIISCVCCQKQGWSNGRGLREACYKRHKRAGTLAKFPRATRALDVPEWQPTAPLLDQYADLVQRRFSDLSISWELGVGIRQVQRYKAALKARELELAVAG